MLCQGQVKEADYVAAQFLHMRPRPVFVFIGVVLFCLAFWALVYGRSLLLMACLAYLVGVCVFYVPLKAKHTFRQYKAMSEPVTMEMREEGLFFRRTNGEGLMPWAHIIKWRNNKKLVLLYPAGNVFHMIPSHFFAGAEEFQAFLTALATKLGKST